MTTSYELSDGRVAEHRLILAVFDIFDVIVKTFNLHKVQYCGKAQT